MISCGFILLYRKILNNPLWTQLPPAWLKAWIAILLRANYQPTTWWDGSKQINLPAESFVTSIGKLAEFAKVSERQVRGTLNLLETTGAVTRVATNQYSIITITNWEAYQGFAQGGDKPNDKQGDRPTTRAATNGRQASDKRTTTEEQCNKETSNTTGAKTAPEGELFPNFTPTEKPKSEFDIHLERIAEEIHSRHPKRRRNINVAAVQKKLRKICGKGTTQQKVELLCAINRRHAGWCASEEWTNGGGQYANGLRNWLDPAEGLFDVEPPAVCEVEPSGTKYTRVQ